MGTGRPADMRRTVQGLVILTLLAWATQTLLAQWGFGAEEKFVPLGGPREVMVELRDEATILGAEVRLRQIARWPEWDGVALGQTGDLVVARFERGKGTLTIDLEKLRGTLQQAGVNLAGINFCGAMACKVTRSDPQRETVLEQAIQTVAAPTTRPVVTAATDVVTEAQMPRSLREILVADLVERFGLPVEEFQVRFDSKDEKIVNLSEPHVRFEVERRRERNIGDMAWEVTLITGQGKQKVSVGANVRAWQSQLFAARPIVVKQVFRAEDVIERRTLVDRLAEDGVLAREQVVGQQASRDVMVGAAITARMVEAVQLARVNQLIDVVVERGKVRLTWVAEARENGSYGQTIRVKKPGTREEYSVTLTGQQQGKLVGLPSGGGDVIGAR